MIFDISLEGTNRLRRRIAYDSFGAPKVYIFYTPDMGFSGGDKINVLMFSDRLILTKRDVDPKEYDLVHRVVKKNKSMLLVRLPRKWVEFTKAKEVKVSVDDDGDVTLLKVAPYDLTRLRDVRLGLKKLGARKRKAQGNPANSNDKEE